MGLVTIFSIAHYFIFKEYQFLSSSSTLLLSLGVLLIYLLKTGIRKHISVDDVVILSMLQLIILYQNIYLTIAGILISLYLVQTKSTVTEKSIALWCGLLLLSLVDFLVIELGFFLKLMATLCIYITFWEISQKNHNHRDAFGWSIIPFILSILWMEYRHDQLYWSLLYIPITLVILVTLSIKAYFASDKDYFSYLLYLKRFFYFIGLLLFQFGQKEYAVFVWITTVLSVLLIKLIGSIEEKNDVSKSVKLYFNLLLLLILGSPLGFIFYGVAEISHLFIEQFYFAIVVMLMSYFLLISGLYNAFIVKLSKDHTKSELKINSIKDWAVLVPVVMTYLIFIFWFFREGVIYYAQMTPLSIVLSALVLFASAILSYSTFIYQNATNAMVRAGFYYDSLERDIASMSQGISKTLGGKIKALPQTQYDAVRLFVSGVIKYCVEVMTYFSIWLGEIRPKGINSNLLFIAMFYTLLLLIFLLRY